MDWGSCVENGVATLACLPVVFSNIIDWLLILSGTAAVFFIILSGFKFLTSGGDPKQVEGARKTMTYAIIGLILIILSFFIVKVIGTITGANCIALPFGFSNCK